MLDIGSALVLHNNNNIILVTGYNLLIHIKCLPHNLKVKVTGYESLAYSYCIDLYDVNAKARLTNDNWLQLPHKSCRKLFSQLYCVYIMAHHGTSY